MHSNNRAVSTVVFAIVIIVLLVGVGGAYALGQAGGKATSTFTLTQAGSASTVTVNGAGSTVTVNGAATTVTTTQGGSTVTQTAVQTTSVTSTLQNQASLAQAECTKQSNNVCLTIYSTMDPSAWQNFFAPIFNSEYPWAAGKVQFVGLSAAQLSTRPISEYKVGSVQADIIEGTIGPFYPIVVAGAIQNYSSPIIQQMGLNKTDYDSKGAWVVVFQSPADIVYNPKIMAQDNLPIPKTWTDLANPVYSGHFDFQTATNLATTGSVFYYLYTQMGNASWTQFMKSLAANHPTIATSGGAVTNNAVSGQVPLGIGIYSDYLAAKQVPNASIAVVTPSPTIENPALAGIAKNDPHPQMAKLLEDWWISYAGQAAFAASGRTPDNAILAQGLNLVPSGIPVVTAWGANPGIVFNDETVWSGIFRNIFGA